MTGASTNFAERASEMLLGTSWLGVGGVVVTAAAMYVMVLLLVRVMGLRSLSRISAFDFTVTIAIGAVVGGTVASNQIALAEGAIALVALLALQLAVAHARRRWRWARATENRPLLLLFEGEVLPENLRRASVTLEELYGTLRAAGVVRIEDVLAVVMEPTGSTSVLKREPDRSVDPVLLRGVEGWPR